MTLQSKSHIKKSPRKCSVYGRVRKNEPIEGDPIWLLIADLDFYERKLAIAKKKKTEGRPPHERYANYEIFLEDKIREIDAEIEKRKEIGGILLFDTR